MKLELNKIITLANNEEYLVINSVFYDGIDYYYVAEVNENEDNIKDNYKIVYVSVEDGENLLNEVTGEEKLKTILPLFLER